MLSSRVWAGGRCEGSTDTRAESQDLKSQESVDCSESSSISSLERATSLAKCQLTTSNCKQSHGDNLQAHGSNSLKDTAHGKLISSFLLLLLFSQNALGLPSLSVDTRIPDPLPDIPFDFGAESPLHESRAINYKVERLFRDQITGAESIALDRAGNMFLAIEGGFVLYAHLNMSSRPRFGTVAANHGTFELGSPQLVKIAELNKLQLEASPSDSSSSSAGQPTWHRECRTDEQVYGNKLYLAGGQDKLQPASFRSNVALSRCSKPLGLRLSPDERFLYVVDTLRGLYKVELAQESTVSCLLDFRSYRGRWVEVIHLDQDAHGRPGSQESFDSLEEFERWKQEFESRPSLLNVSLMAVDDLAIDYGAGDAGGDLIYMTVASQSYLADMFIYDLLEGRPSGLVVRYDTGKDHLVVLDPKRLAHVLERPRPTDKGASSSSRYDDRPLHFPNGLEFTDDRRALLIVDTNNRRILKHHVRGPRAGTTDLWAWTPNYPDNIRRGCESGRETFWVVGCGEGRRRRMQMDPVAMLRTWPGLRKHLLKNIYLTGWLIESMGAQIFQSTSLLDFGYSIRIGHLVNERICPGMMIIQYAADGTILRSIHSREFPNDLVYYSQVNELMDSKTGEHALYLSSPSYRYVTKLIIPTMGASATGR